ncbi:hypothetical protein I3760_08G018200 [Carya illinoinensis]|nr:hypothetical protein I3760_08G018200 [Carya illinoinensis]
MWVFGTWVVAWLIWASRWWHTPELAASVGFGDENRICSVCHEGGAGMKINDGWCFRDSRLWFGFFIMVAVSDREVE